MQTLAAIGERTARCVLVRGATGFLGGALAEGLLDDCSRLRLFCRNSGALSPGLLANPAVEVVVGDALDPRAVADSLLGVDLVIDCVGATLPAIRPGDLLPEVERNLAPLAILLDAMARPPARRLIFPSSGGAIYGAGRREELTEESPTAPEGAYGLGKLLAEEMIRFRARRSEASHLILRASNVYGRPRRRAEPQGVCDIFLDRAARGEAIEIWGDGSQIRDYLFIDDFVRAVRGAAPVAGERRGRARLHGRRQLAPRGRRRRRSRRRRGGEGAIGRMPLCGSRSQRLVESETASPHRLVAAILAAQRNRRGGAPASARPGLIRTAGARAIGASELPPVGRGDLTACRA